MRLHQPGLIFKVMQQRDPAINRGTALAQPSDETPVAESSNDDAVCSYDYEISNETLNGGLIAVTGAVDHIPGLGVGDVGWRVGLCHGL
jgi:hypothetical protein